MTMMKFHGKGAFLENAYYKQLTRLSKWVYTGVVEPKLLYACMTWEKSINTPQQLKKIKA